MFSLNYLVNLIYETAAGHSKKKIILVPIVGILYLSLIVLFIILSLIADKFLNIPEAILNPFSQILGISIISFGFLLYAFSISYFIKLRGTPVPFNPPPKLITAGPYRFSRNPMLTGLFIMLFGIGFFLGSVSLVFIFTPLFIFINLWEIKKVEEPELKKRIGEEYIIYKRTVPMFLPFFKNRRH